MTSQRWTVLPAAVAPIALIGGWFLAQSRQPAHYDPVRDTISALAARGAVDPAIMTAGLALLGVCHLATATLFRDAGRPARSVLAVGGAATVLVSIFAQPNAGHVPAATVGFVALALWPALLPTPLRRRGIVATIVLLGLLAWLGAELAGSGALLGLAERFLAGAQSLVPLGFVLVATGRRSEPARPRR